MSAKKLDELFERERNAEQAITKPRTRSFFVTEQELNQWTKIRTAGKQRYITLHWILGFGLCSALAYTLVSHWFFSKEIDLLRLVLALLIWPLFGMMEGLRTWTRMEKLHRKFIETHSGSDAASDPAPGIKNDHSSITKSTTKKRIIQGGSIMSIIGAIIISASLLMHRQPDGMNSTKNVAKSQTQSATQMQKSIAPSHESIAELRQQHREIIHLSETSGVPSGAQHISTNTPPIFSQTTPVTGGGAPERIEPLRVYLLDPATLDRIGVHVDDDGEITYSSGVGMPMTLRIEGQYNVYSFTMVDVDTTVKPIEVRPSMEALKKRPREEFRHVLITDSHGNRYEYDQTRSGSKHRRSKENHSRGRAREQHLKIPFYSGLPHSDTR